MEGREGLLLVPRWDIKMIFPSVCAVCVATGEALYKHLSCIIPALIDSLKSTNDGEMWAAAEGVVLSVQGEPGPSILIEQLCKASQDGGPDTRTAAMALLYTLCSRSTASLTEHIPHLLIFTTESLNDPSEPMCEKAWLALEATVKVTHDVMVHHRLVYEYRCFLLVCVLLL